jgi:sugar/nucleoside kinase (ribokinase family)
VRATVASWLPFTRHALFNDLETLSLSDAPDLEQGAAWVLGRMPRDGTLVVKCGAEGARAWQGSQRLHCRAPAVRVVDTVGAGDAFNAGYLHGMRDGLSTSPRRYDSDAADAGR